MSALFAKLPESNPHRRRSSAADLVASVLLHAVVVTLAVVATLHAGAEVRREPGPDTTMIWVAPRPPKPTPTRASASSATRSIEASSTAPRNPISTTNLPRIDLPEPSVLVAEPDPMPWSPARAGDAGRESGSAGGDGVAPGGVFDGVQVEVQASLLRGGAPRYPESLREARVEGRVLVRFVVDSAGRVESGTVRVVSSTDPLFTAAVRSALPRMRFTPARAGGQHVRQLVELPFEFAVER